jgi:hypothetical protein
MLSEIDFKSTRFHSRFLRMVMVLHFLFFREKIRVFFQMLEGVRHDQ